MASMGKEYVSLSHKTMHWLMGQAGLGQIQCCQEGGLVKCYDTGTGKCILTWVSTAKPQNEPPCPICVPGGAPPSPVVPPAPSLAPPPTVEIMPPPPTSPPIIGPPIPPRPRPVIPPTAILPPFIRPPPPAKVPPIPGVGMIEIGIVTRILELSETAWIQIERARIRARRCSATAAEKGAAAAGERCLIELRTQVGELRRLVDELCAAKIEGRPARVSPAQAEALEAFARCVEEALGTAGAEPAGTPWLEALIGTGLPIVGSVLVAA